MSGEEILIVEDNPINLKLANLLLTIEGYQVQTAINAAEALSLLKTFHPILILMDIQLPGKNGLELAREIKADLTLKDIYIVALTAYAMKGDEDKAKAAGCDGYMTKPILPASFPAQIANFILKQKTQTTIERKNQ